MRLTASHLLKKYLILQIKLKKCPPPPPDKSENGLTVLTDANENAVEYVTNLKSLADKTKSVHPIVGKKLDENIEDLQALKNGMTKRNYLAVENRAYDPKHVPWLPLKSDQLKMKDLAKRIRDLNIRSGVKIPSVELNDQAVDILENLNRKGYIHEDMKIDETIQEYRALPPEIRALITKSQQSQPRKGIVA